MYKKFSGLESMLSSWEYLIGYVWWHTLLILEFGRQREVDLREFEASQFYIVNSRAARFM